MKYYWIKLGCWSAIDGRLDFDIVCSHHPFYFIHIVRKEKELNKVTTFNSVTNFRFSIYEDIPYMHQFSISLVDWKEISKAEFELFNRLFNKK
jgi:hypothetical protein